jgi:threonine/homoserine/homoserine lactone efflux protein
MRRLPDYLLTIAGVVSSSLPFIWVHRLFESTEPSGAWMAVFIAFGPILGVCWLLAGSCFISLGYRMTRLAPAQELWRRVMSRTLIVIVMVVGFVQLAVSVYRLTMFLTDPDVSVGV